MRNKNQRGAIDPLLIPLIICVVIVLALAGFSVWSYGQYLDHKNNVDSKVVSAVAEAETAQQSELEAAFLQREKNPLKTYISPGSTGSITLKYPKTWSAYIVEDEDGRTPLDIHIHPSFVPSLKSEVALALRVTLEGNSYADEVEDYDGQVVKGELTAKPFRKAGVTGVRFDGNIDDELEGSLVIFPLRDKTLKIWTESTSFRDDFDNIILRNLNFIP